MADLRALSSRARRLLVRWRRPLSALLAAVAALVVIQALSPASPATRPVVVAAADLTSGSSLQPGDVKVVQMPPGVVPAGFTSVVADVVGHVVAAPMRVGEVVTDRRLLGRSLMAGYPPGDVAAPVRVRDAVAVTLLSVGDRIDVYAAHSDTAAADRVVGDATVVALPHVDNDDEQGGLVVLSVTRSQAALLAEASATVPLSWTLVR